MLQIISEDFKLSEANKVEIQNRAKKIIELIGEAADIKVFVSTVKAGIFSITFKVGDGKKVFISSDQCDDFNNAINKAKQRMMRQLRDHHGRDQHHKDIHRGA